MVRGIVHDDGFKVSESAVWLLVVAVRQYVASLLKRTISNLESVATNQSLPAIEFSQCAMRSGNMYKKGTPDSSTETKEAGTKRRRITPLDVATVLNAGGMGEEGLLGGSALRLAVERCSFASYDESQLFLSPGFDSVQSFIAESINLESKKPKHEWLDPDPAAERTLDDISPSSSQLNEKDTDQIPSKSSPLPAGGLGREAKNLAMLKARAAAAAAAANSDAASASSARAIDGKPPDQSSPGTGKPFNQSGDNGASGADKQVLPQQGARSGKGKGFGVKNLAAMRARSVSASPASAMATAGSAGDKAPSPDPKAISGSSGSPKLQDSGTGGAPAGNVPVGNLPTKLNGGKELRRLEEARARHISESPEVSGVVSQSTDGSPPSVHERNHSLPVRVQGNSGPTE